LVQLSDVKGALDDAFSSSPHVYDGPVTVQQSPRSIHEHPVINLFSLHILSPHAICMQDHVAAPCVDIPDSEEEATCLVELVNIERTICNIVKVLAEHRLAGATLRVRLLRIQAQKAQKKLDEANSSVGDVRSAVRRGGYSIYPDVLPLRNGW
jgi:hypothetical protein